MTPSRFALAVSAVLFSLFFSSSSLAAGASIDSVLADSWKAYKAQFIQPDGRVVDRQNNNISTSEGQAYALLRAVWIDDRETFDQVFKWSADNLRTRGDQLFSWKWGYDAQTNRWAVQDRASASDADQDIAVALILAHRRWDNAGYLAAAKRLCGSIWKQEIVIVGGKPFVVAADWAAERPQPPLNPSYLAPYAYRLFGEIDPEHDWKAVLDTAYETLFESLTLSSAGLPPDWCAISRETGHLTSIQLNGEASSDYSYDAWRILWRIALDDEWYHDPRSLQFIKAVKFPLEFWKKNRHLCEAFMKDGRVRSDTETIAMLGSHLPAFARVDKKSAKQIFEDRLMASYARLGSRGVWGNPKDYYSQNWAWFGIALYGGKLSRFEAAPPAQKSQAAARRRPTSRAASNSVRSNVRSVSVKPVRRSS